MKVHERCPGILSQQVDAYPGKQGHRPGDQAGAGGTARPAESLVCLEGRAVAFPLGSLSLISLALHKQGAVGTRFLSIPAVLSRSTLHEMSTIK